jgi:hypothetical protein
MSADIATASTVRRQELSATSRNMTEAQLGAFRPLEHNVIRGIHEQSCSDFIGNGCRGGNPNDDGRIGYSAVTKCEEVCFW